MFCFLYTCLCSFFLATIRLLTDIPLRFMKFQDRRDAAQKLYSRLEEIETGKIAALPNDSVLIARYIANQLNVPLDMIAVEHLKSPKTGEKAGAVTHSGVMHLDDSADYGFSPALVEWERIRLMIEAKRFRRLFHVEKTFEEDPYSALLVDDGTSDVNGLLAACKHLYRSGVEEVIVALPFVLEEDYQELIEVADRVEVVFRDENLNTSEVYDSVGRLSEEQFRRCVQG